LAALPYFAPAASYQSPPLRLHGYWLLAFQKSIVTAGSYSAMFASGTKTWLRPGSEAADGVGVVAGQPGAEFCSHGAGLLVGGGLVVGGVDGVDGVPLPPGL
jgi:hypothetical protein